MNSGILSSQTVSAVAQKLGAHYSTVSRHLKLIGKIDKQDKWKSHENMARSLEIFISLTERNERDPFSHRSRNVRRKMDRVQYLIRQQGI